MYVQINVWYFLSQSHSHQCIIYSDYSEDRELKWEKTEL